MFELLDTQRLPSATDDADCSRAFPRATTQCASPTWHWMRLRWGASTARSRV